RRPRPRIARRGVARRSPDRPRRPPSRSPQMRWAMKRTMRGLLTLVFLALAGAMPFPPDSPVVLETEVFPVAPAVDDQRGFAVAIDGEWLAIGARLEDVDGKEDAGAV